MASQHCLASFWRQKNIKISSDLGKMVKKNRSACYNESESAFYNESGSSPRFIRYREKGVKSVVKGAKEAAADSCDKAAGGELVVSRGGLGRQG